jgi:hypothetical protein
MSIIPTPGNKKPAATFRIAAGSLKVCAFYQAVSTSFSNFAGPLSFEKK